MIGCFISEKVCKLKVKDVHLFRFKVNLYTLYLYVTWILTTLVAEFICCNLILVICSNVVQ